jgi:hypothetical protein
MATERWDDRWYTGLTPTCKMILEYIQGTCDVSGVWEPNFEVAEFKIGFTATKTPIDWSEMFEELNRIPPDRLKNGDVPPSGRKLIPHVVILPSGKWWLVRFIAFQYGRQGMDFFLSDSSPLHIPIFRKLAEHGLWQKFIEFFPDCVPKGMKLNPPNSLVGRRGLPTLEEVRGWPEAAGMEDADIRMFFYHHKSLNWRIGGVLAESFPDLLEKWRARAERDRGPDAWKGESAVGLKIRIDSVDKKIDELKTQVYVPLGKQHSEVKPDAMAEIKRLKGLKEQYETELRERNKGKKKSSGSGADANPAAK